MWQLFPHRIQELVIWGVWILSREEFKRVGLRLTRLMNSVPFSVPCLKKSQSSFVECNIFCCLRDKACPSFIDLGRSDIGSPFCQAPCVILGKPVPKLCEQKKGCGILCFWSPEGCKLKWLPRKIARILNTCAPLNRYFIRKS